MPKEEEKDKNKSSNKSPVVARKVLYPEDEYENSHAETSNKEVPIATVSVLEIKKPPPKKGAK